MLMPVRRPRDGPRRRRDARPRAPPPASSERSGSARTRDHAVRAIEGTAVLDLDERPRSLPARSSRTVDVSGRHVHARQRRQRSPACGPKSARARAPGRRAERPSTTARSASIAANASGADVRRAARDDDLARRGCARRARRTAWRDLRSASAVTVQVLMTTRSAGTSARRPSGRPAPRVPGRPLPRRRS